MKTIAVQTRPQIVPPDVLGLNSVMRFLQLKQVCFHVLKLSMHITKNANGQKKQMETMIHAMPNLFTELSTSTFPPVHPFTRLWQLPQSFFTPCFSISSGAWLFGNGGSVSCIVRFVSGMLRFVSGMLRLVSGMLRLVSGMLRLVSGMLRL